MHYTICMRDKLINFSIAEHRFTIKWSVPGHLDEETGHQPGWIRGLRVCPIERHLKLLRQNIYDYTQFSRSFIIHKYYFFFLYRELSVRHKEHMRKVTKLRLQADLGPNHYKGYDKLEQLREAVRLKISLNMTRQRTETS